MMQKLQPAIDYINDAVQIVALTGAGISTEAGIPDFRSEGGLWENHGLMEQLSSQGFIRNPAGFYSESVKLLPDIHKAQPTPAHKLLAKLEERGRLKAIITQNIDGLHQAAGSKTVYEVHGTFKTGTCIRCRRSYVMQEFYEKIFNSELSVPECSQCSSPIKPDVVLFGDLLSVEIWERAVEAVRECDLLMVMGSSLVIYPAADLPNIALERSANLMIINREPTDFDELAAVTVRMQLGEFADAIMEHV